MDLVLGKELRNWIKNIFKGKIIRGVELNTKVLGIPIEILGYGVDTDYMNSNLKKLYISNQERNKIEVERIYQICLDNNIEVGENFIENYNPEMYASKYLHQIITQNDTPTNTKIIISNI